MENSFVGCGNLKFLVKNDMESPAAESWDHSEPNNKRFLDIKGP